MSKGLKALKNIRREAGTPYFSTLYDIEMWIEDFDIVEKELEALEIIKNKEVNVILIKFSTNLSDYNETRPEEDKLIQEEYDLLEEVLYEEES